MATELPGVGRNMEEGSQARPPSIACTEEAGGEPNRQELIDELAVALQPLRQSRIDSIRTSSKRSVRFSSGDLEQEERAPSVLRRHVSFIRKASTVEDLGAEEQLALGKELSWVQSKSIEESESPKSPSDDDGPPQLRFLWRHSTNFICPYKYPAYALPLQDFLEMKELLPHQQLLEEQKLEQVHPGSGKTVLFISHQWLGHDHPDKDGRQLRVMQTCLSNLRDGVARAEMDFALEVKSMLSYENLITGAVPTVEQLANAYVWMDYIAVPQPQAARSRSEAARLRKKMRLAIDSIVGYIQLASYFLVLAPPLGHEEREGAVMDYSSWTRRGWCIVERMTWALTKHVQSRVMLLVEQGSKVMVLSSKLESSACGLNSAEWSEEKDRETLVHIMQALLKRKLATLHDSGMLDEYRSMLGLWPRLLYGTNSHDYAWDFGRSSQVECFGHDPATVLLSNFCLQSATKGDGLGRTALHLAAVCGNVSGVRALLAQGGDPAAAITRSALHSPLPLGSTPLHATALFFGERDEAAQVIDLLLAARSSINGRLRSMVDTPPIAFAAANNNCQVVELLLDRRADLEHHHTFVGRPLAMACHCSSGAAAALLLKRRADPNTRNFMGLTPTHAAVLMVGSALEVLPSLAESRADLEAKAKPFIAWRPLVAGLRVAWRCGWHRKLTAVARARDATPLMVAAMVGNTQGINALLAARASLCTRNCEGLTAFDLARRWNTLGSSTLNALKPADQDSRARTGRPAAGRVDCCMPFLYSRGV